MNEAARKRSVANKSIARASEPLRSVLVPIDLSPSADRVLGRLALLPLADDAIVTLLHIVPDSLHPGDQRSAERDANKALAEDVRHLSRSLPKTVRIETVVKIGAAAKEIAACASAVEAELIVMGRGGRSLRDIFLGSTAERVIRRGQLPVLVVRLAPRAVYSRPAIALDLDQAAHEVLALALRVVQPPRPRVAIIHAFDAPYEGLGYPSISEDDAEGRRGELKIKITQDVAKLLSTSLAQAKISPEQAPRWTMHIRYGSPRLVIEKAVKRADTDLLVLGTHGYRGVAHVFLGTVAGEVLRDVACDVLIVPPGPTARRKT